ncbi:MAG: glycosyltransferase family 39 protein [Spirochaetota bacterium]
MKRFWVKLQRQGVIAKWATGFFVALALLLLVTFLDYGISWDENLQNMYGRWILKYFKSGFEDDLFLAIPSINGYGGLFDFLIAFFNQAVPSKYRIEFRHFFTVMTGFVAILGVYFTGRTLAGKVGGLLAAITLTAIPTFYGHIFMNPKDIPFACGYIWSLYFFILLLRALPKPSKKLLWRAGLACGFAMGVRIGGLLLIAYLGLCFLLLLPVLNRRKQEVSFAINFKDLFFLGCKIVLIAYVVMIIFWPFALQNPILNPFKALFQAGNFNRESIEMFEGKWLNSWDAKFPRHYLTKYFLVNLPEFVLIFIVPASLFFVVKCISLWRREKFSQSLGYFVVFFSLFFPLVYIHITGSPVYNGNRHFTFILPSLACLVGVFLSRILVWSRKKGTVAFATVTVCLGIYGAFHIWQLAKIHPYQYIYYNSFAGGLKAAEKNYELDYFATSNAELVRNFLRYTKKNPQLYPQNKIYKVAFCSDPLTLTHYLPKNYLLITSKKQAASADFLFTSPRHHTKQAKCFPEIQGKIVARVQRQGVVLSYVMALTPTKTN